MLLKKAENQSAFAKVGILGFPGSGKSYTAALIACGLAQGGQIAFVDTEAGSDYLMPLFKKSGSELMVLKSKAFTDLLTVVGECEAGGIKVLIVDSITHIWRELCDTYQTKLKRTRLQFQDWNLIKGEWNKWTSAFLNSKLHIIICGRAGFEYDYDSDKDLIKTGTKMKVESEFGFEPSLLIEMERTTPEKEHAQDIANIENKAVRAAAKTGLKARPGSLWLHRAHVLKDRADRINGQVFDAPIYLNFKPHFDALNIGGEHLAVDTSRRSDEAFSDVPGYMTEERKFVNRLEIVHEKIKAHLDTLWPGRSDAAIQGKKMFSEVAFNTVSWTEVEVGRSLEDKEKATRGMELLISQREAVAYTDRAALDAWWKQNVTEPPAKPDVPL